MLLVPSAYNVTLDDGTVFNTVSGAFLRPDSRQAAFLGSRETMPAGEESWLETLRKGGFAVPGAVRETMLLKARWYEAVTKDRSPTLTIAPTMNCNFGCDYCFESHEPGVMTPEVRGQLIRFIETQLAAQAAYPLSVTWFGGEPLMGLSAITDLSDRFDALVDSGVLSEWNAFMITNGHLLTRKTLDALEGRHITGFQVTLDGPRAIHDTRRVLKAGRKATFDRICANLIDVPTTYGLSIRVNVDRRNAEHLEELVGQLHENGVLGRPNTSIYLANVENYDRADAQHGDLLLTNREFARVQQRFVAHCEAAGLPCEDEGMSSSIEGVCQVDNVNAFVVDCDGSLMKCWAELRNRPEIVATLLDEATWPEPKLTSFEERDPFDDAECLECPVLPLCMGSCPKLRQMRRRFDFKMCPPIKHSLKDVLARKVAQIEAGEELAPGRPMQDRSTRIEEIANGA